MERIKAVTREIEHLVVGDIGCDHAYTAINAILSGKASYVYACDIKKGPLGRAAYNISKYGLSDKIGLKLGNGLKPLIGTGVLTVIIAGLGGFLTIEILSEGLDHLPEIKQLILQPMSEIKKVRIYIHSIGYMIKNEQLVYEGNKFYFILNCAPGQEPGYSEAEYELGRVLLYNKSDVFKKYIKAEIIKTKAIINRIESESANGADTRKHELTNRLEMLKGV